MVLENQVAIVTGGGQGIGKAIAVRCASEGAQYRGLRRQRGHRRGRDARDR